MLPSEGLGYNKPSFLIFQGGLGEVREGLLEGCQRLLFVLQPTLYVISVH